MEPFVRQPNIVPVVVPLRGPFSRRVACLPRKLRDRVRRQRFANDRPHIGERKPPAIVQVPIVPAEARKLGPHVQFRMRQLPYELVELERIAMHREFRGNVGRKRRIFARRQFHLLPLKIADVRFTGGRPCSVFQYEFQVSAPQRKRHAPVVHNRAAIAQLELPNLQIEKRPCPRLAVRGQLRDGQIAAAVLFELHVCFWPLDNQLIHSELAAKKRKYAQSDAHSRCVKKRRRPRAFPSVERQIVQLGAQTQRVQMKSSQLHARSRFLLELAYHCIAHTAFHPPGFKRYKCKQHRHRKKHQCASQPPLPTHPHDAVPCETMSSFRCSRVSSTHFFARSLIARCTSTSRIVSSTSSSAGTVSPRAFNCGANSSLKYVSICLSSTCAAGRKRESRKLERR